MSGSKAAVADLISDAEQTKARKPARNGKSVRKKGDRTEREVVRILQDHGIASERIPLSGSAGGSFGADVTVPILGRDHKLEVKCRADGFGFQYDNIEGVFGLVIKRDRSKPLICIRLEDFAALIRKADEYRAQAEQ